jgi:hypothetical protein
MPIMQKIPRIGIEPRTAKFEGCTPQGVQILPVTHVAGTACGGWPPALRSRDASRKPPRLVGEELNDAHSGVFYFAYW